MKKRQSVSNSIEKTKVLAGHMFVETGNVSLSGKARSSLKTNPQAAKVGFGKGGGKCEPA